MLNLSLNIAYCCLSFGERPKVSYSQSASMSCTWWHHVALPDPLCTTLHSFCAPGSWPVRPGLWEGGWTEVNVGYLSSIFFHRVTRQKSVLPFVTGHCSIRKVSLPHRPSSSHHVHSSNFKVSDGGSCLSCEGDPQSLMQNEGLPLPARLPLL